MNKCKIILGEENTYAIKRWIFFRRLLFYVRDKLKYRLRTSKDQ